MGKSRNSQRRALSASFGGWQLHAGVFALAMTAPVAAAPGGQIATLPLGDYRCELPGDATGPAGLHQPGEDFSVVSSSSYRASGSMGSYLMTGDTLTMTSGPRTGKRYRRMSDGFVRLIDERGQPGDLRCVKRHRNADGGYLQQ